MKKNKEAVKLKTMEWCALLQEEDEETADGEPRRARLEDAEWYWHEYAKLVTHRLSASEKKVRSRVCMQTHPTPH